MSDKVFHLANATITLNGKEIDLTSNMLRVISPDNDRIAGQAARIVGQTFTLRGTFTPSPEFWGILVGMQLRYGLREVHRNLGRYTCWPYTN